MIPKPSTGGIIISRWPLEMSLSFTRCTSAPLTSKKRDARERSTVPGKNCSIFKNWGSMLWKCYQLQSFQAIFHGVTIRSIPLPLRAFTGVRTASNNLLKKPTSMESRSSWMWFTITSAPLISICGNLTVGAKMRRAGFTFIMIAALIRLGATLGPIMVGTKYASTYAIMQ